MDKVTIIDVIVPCYNVESVIGRCIESLLDQTISNEEYQCFFINDCSTDNTHRVLERYKNIKNITIINQKENLGLAATRNTGIKKGDSKMVAFLDGDMTVEKDWLDLNLIARLLNLSSTNCLIFCRASICNRAGISSLNNSINNSAIFYF